MVAIFGTMAMVRNIFHNIKYLCVGIQDEFTNTYNSTQMFSHIVKLIYYKISVLYGCSIQACFLLVVFSLNSWHKRVVVA